MKNEECGTFNLAKTMSGISINMSFGFIQMEKANAKANEGNPIYGIFNF